MKKAGMVLKRTFDIVSSIGGLVLLSPVLFIESALIKVYMPGPVLFKQERVGRHGKLFILFKFRTMVTDHSGSSISIKGEERIPKLGAFLRKYKLDEFLELWNVLKGDMSFVGPRPDLPEYTNRLHDNEKLILSLRPGITGPATLKYSNEEEILASVKDPKLFNDQILWPDKVKINLDYYHNRNFMIDMVIIFKTIFCRRKISSNISKQNLESSLTDIT
jgi:lipopolysaccharide/colanic/teichoic acid biosynthesis glycosyltransferase